jgi:hypothetical protein
MRRLDVNKLEHHIDNIRLTVTFYIVPLNQLAEVVRGHSQSLLDGRGVSQVWFIDQLSSSHGYSARAAKGRRLLGSILILGIWHRLHRRLIPLLLRVAGATDTWLINVGSW